MTPAERGFLLLTSTLGDPARPVLTAAELRTLARRAVGVPAQNQERDLSETDLIRMGFSAEFGRRVERLLGEESRLDRYLAEGARLNCFPICRVSEKYPHAVRRKLNPDAPGCLWYKGDLSLLEGKKIALVGSRDIPEPNRLFAREVGIRAAEQGYTLVSGNARGSDRTAQEACLSRGGKVISIVADELWRREGSKDLLLLSEEGYDLPFSSVRALSRNRLIHCLGDMTFVACCTLEKGGTWSGTTQNLRHGWSPVFQFDDGSPSSAALSARGARLIQPDALRNIEELSFWEPNLFDR